MENNNVTAAITGAATALTYWWAANEDDKTQETRDLRAQIRQVDQQTQIFYSSGDYYRMQAPVIRDISIGYAVAMPASKPKSNVPQIVGPIARPDLSSGSNIAQLSYPPKTGTYDASGRTSEPGEMALAAWVQTYQESRAFSQGLLRTQPPTQTEALNLFFSAQGLSHQSMRQNLTQQQWQMLWEKLLTGGSAGLQGVHEDATKHPVASGGNANITVHPLTQGVLIGVACPFVNPNTDSAHHWRFISTSALAADDLVMTVTFAAAYQRKLDGNNSPFQPVVHVHRGSHFYVKNVTAAGYQIYAAVAVAANVATDIDVSVHAGTSTV